MRTIDLDGLTVPATWKICNHCDGEGHHAKNLGAFTSEDLADRGEDWANDYFAGHLDSTCECCGGTGKVLTPDYSKMSKAEREEADAHYEAIAFMDAEAAAERRFGC